MRTLNKAIDYCVLALAAVAGVILLFLLLSVCFATLSRYLFSKPFAFLVDYAAYSLLFIAFFGAPWLMQKKGHVGIDMVPEALPPGLRRYWLAVIDLVVALIAAALCYLGGALTISNFVGKVVVSDFLLTPKWILLSAIPIGSFFLTIQALRNGAEKLSKGGEKEGGA